MATVLRQLFQPVQSSLGDDQPIAEDWNGEEPKRFIFREIDFEIDLDGALQFFFLDPVPAMPLPKGGINDVLDALLNLPLEIRSNFAASLPAPVYETPLDLNVKDSPAFVIYRLR